MQAFVIFRQSVFDLDKYGRRGFGFRQRANDVEGTFGMSVRLLMISETRRESIAWFAVIVVFSSLDRGALGICDGARAVQYPPPKFNEVMMERKKHTLCMDGLL